MRFLSKRDAAARRKEGKRMNIITISREFGSGGREPGKRLADITGYDYYDSEIIAAAAKKSGMDEAYIENTLSNHGWRNQAITFRGTLASSAYVESSKVQLLLEQKEVITGIAQMGKDCVIVGRNADVILREYELFNIFVCASAEAKPKRCRERAAKGGKPERKGADAPDEKDRQRAPSDRGADDRLAVGIKGRLSAYSKYNTMADKAVGTGGCIFSRLLVWEKTMKQRIQLSDHFTYGRLIRFTLPSIGMMIFTSIYGVVDGFFVSNFAGKTPFAAINLIMPFLMILSTVGFMFG